MKSSEITCGFVERARAAAKLALAFVLVATLTVYVPTSPSRAYAASGPVGTMTVDGKTTEYSTYAELAHALENLTYKEVTIKMLRDWRRLESTNGFPRLVIPVDSNVTLNMNGHMIDKMNIELPADMKEDDGEVIRVLSGANLTINGGTKEISHSVHYYDSTAENASSIQATRSGGVITGGSSTNGGGSAGSSSAATKPSSSNAAKTGDPLAVLPAIAVTLAVASACCLAFVRYARRRCE